MYFFMPSKSIYSCVIIVEPNSCELKRDPNIKEKNQSWKSFCAPRAGGNQQLPPLDTP